jgi:hypothetical protein
MKMRSKEERADYPYVHGANFQMKSRTSVTQNQRIQKTIRVGLCVSSFRLPRGLSKPFWTLFFQTKQQP